ncbi:MAG: 1-acyl-sn-glycerol-3-phosphate acyltransferase [Gammaproteobacteria bacterium]|nr:1-acyl-sn-glycerol-3-phosphate acyltransferase [Gammaproteobacteria bacterium]
MMKKFGHNSVVLFLRACLYFIGTFSTILFFSPLSLLLVILFVPYRWRFKIISRWGHFNIWWLKITCGVGYRVEGLGNIPNDTAAIIYSKHESTWETYAMQKFFPPHAWIMKRELLWIPLFGWGLASLNPIAIDRKSGSKAIHQITDLGTRKLNEGQWVMVFPEGTRVKNGRMKRFGIGGALLAEKSGFPIIPVAHNAGAFWPRGKFIKTPGTIQIVIGQPILSTGKTVSEINAEAEQWMQTTMERINGRAIEIVARK